MTVEEQLKNLRNKAPPFWFAYAALAAGACALGAGIYSGLELLVAVGVFVLFGAFQAHRTSRDTRSAIKALDSGRRERGKVFIHIDVSDTLPEYRVKILPAYGVSWDTIFHPRDWTPKGGLYQAELLFTVGLEWPALLILEQGVILPGFKPIRNPRRDLLLPEKIEIGDDRPT